MHSLHRFYGFILSLMLRGWGNRVGKSLRCESLNIFYRIGRKRKIFIGNNVFIGRGCRFKVHKGCVLKIGDNVHFTGNAYLSSDCSVTIGNNTKIAEFCTIRDSNHCIKRDELIVKQSVNVEAIEIGEDVWLGAGVRVLMGAKIPTGAVIAANAVVLGKTIINEYEVFGGVPAKKIGDRE